MDLLNYEERISDITARVEEHLRREPPVNPANHDVVRYAPPAVRTLPLPEYVEHRQDIDQIGKAASEAIVQQYEAATSALEAMGKQLIQEVQTISEQTNAVVKTIIETCADYREASKVIFARIEHASAMTTEVRKVCDELRDKIKVTQQ